MTGIRERKTWIVFIAVLLLFAACKGETPTAPPTGGGSPPGTNPPPTGVSVTLTSSSATPLVDTTVTITATVTQGGQPVPNGTAVEFTSTGGVLDGDDQDVIKTTTNGVATVSLTSTSATPITVSATVNNVTQRTNVTFLARPIVPVPPNTSPTITSVTPNVGKPSGGEIIRITGTNFRGPVKVLFRLPNQNVPVEASVVSATETAIEVVTPGVNLGVGQELQAEIIVVTQAGTTSENRVSRTNAFTFRAQRLTPVLFSITPNSGPVLGGTRVTLVGEGFQEPVQVLFNTAEARVLNVTFNEIIVETPPASDTPPTGSGAVTGAVNVTVRNLNSQTSGTLDAGFNYKSAMVITAVGPGGAIAGIAGTRVTIDGDGFVGPVVVNVRTGEGDITLQPISVTGTRIVAIAPAILPDTCDNLTGNLVVTNVVNGDQAEGPPFTFFVPNPVVANVNPASVTAGGNTTVTVANALPGPARITLGTRTVFPSAITFDEATRTATFQIAVPSDFTFPTVPCTVDGVTGTRQTSIRVDVGYENVATTCEDIATEALTINPLDTTCVVPPPPNAAITPVTPPCQNMGAVAFTGTATGTTTFTITNTGGRPLIISSATVVAPSNATVTVSPTSGTVAPQASQTFTVTADPAAAGTFGGTIRVNSNDPDTPALDFCFTGNGT